MNTISFEKYAISFYVLDDIHRNESLPTNALNTAVEMFSTVYSMKLIFNASRTSQQGSCGEYKNKLLTTYLMIHYRS